MDEKRMINDPYMTKNDIIFIFMILLGATLLTIILLTALTNAGYTEITFGGRITIDECTTPPGITNITSTPNPQHSGGYVNITANITTTCGTIDTLILYIYHPNETLLDYNMTQLDSTITYYNNNTYTSIGEYTYFIWVNDTAGNHHQCIAEHFIINEAGSPNITEINDQPDPQEQNGYINISCNVTDETGVDTVTVNITYPDSNTSNTSMTQIGETSYYYYNTTYNQIGIHTYHIWANDTLNNKNLTTGYTFIITNATPPAPSLDCPHAMLIYPLNNSKINTRDTILTVYVYDDDTFIWELNITFYDASDDSIISHLTTAVDWNVSTAWTNLTPGQTYNWYVYLDNGTGNYTSGIFSFTVSTDIIGTASDFWGTWVLLALLCILLILCVIFHSFIVTVFALVSSSLITYTYMGELLGTGNLFDEIMFYIFIGILLAILIDLLYLVFKEKK